MDPERRDRIIRRILVALDASPHSRVAMEAAVELASRLEAELLGIFVEDIDLLRLAELPLREITLSGARRSLDAAQIESELRAQAVQIERALARMATRSRIQWSFRVARGVVAAELLSAASDRDLIILGRAGRSLVRRRGLGSTARTVLSQASCLALILHYGARLGMPVLVVYDGSALGDRALAAAAALAQPGGEGLTVLLPAGDAAEQLQARAAGSLQRLESNARYRTLTEASLPGLVRFLQSEACGVLVLPARTALMEDEAVLALLDQVEIPVLLVR